MMNSKCGWTGVIIFSLYIIAIDANNKKRICYVNSLNQNSNNNDLQFNLDKINVNLCTHLIYSFATIDHETVVPLNKINDVDLGGYLNFTQLKLRNPELKTIISIRDEENNFAQFSNLLNNINQRRNLNQNILKFLKDFQFDGVDFFWQYVGSEFGSGYKCDKKNYVKFLKELRKTFKDDASSTGQNSFSISIGIPYHIDKVKRQYYDVTRLDQYVDWFNVMKYDSVDFLIAGRNNYTVDEDPIDYYLRAGAFRNKIVLGISIYGLLFTMESSDQINYTDMKLLKDSPFNIFELARNVEILSYSNICMKIKNNPKWKLYVEEFGTFKRILAINQNEVIVFKDVRIVREDVEQVLDLNLGGIALWTIDQDDFNGVCIDQPYPLLDTINKVLKKKSDLKDVTPIDISLGQNVIDNNKLEKFALETEISKDRIVCYTTSWSIYRSGPSKFNQGQIDPNLCTHLIYAYARVENETVKVGIKNSDIELGGYSDFIKLRSANDKLKLLIGLPVPNQEFSIMIADIKKRKNFIDNVLNFLNEYGFDGIDLAWMEPRSEDKQNLVKLLYEMRIKFLDEKKNRSKQYLISIQIPSNLEVSGYDFPKLNSLVDWYNLRSYNYRSPNEITVNHIAPLYGIEEIENNLNVNATVHYYLNVGIERTKLVVGIPTYGVTFTLRNSANTTFGAKAEGPGLTGTYTNSTGLISYFEICEIQQSNSNWLLNRPYPARVGPYIVNDKQWIGYDDEIMIKNKVEYVINMKLGGINFWTIDQDDFSGACGSGLFPIIQAAKEALVNKLSNSNNILTTTLSTVPFVTRNFEKPKSDVALSLENTTSTTLILNRAGEDIRDRIVCYTTNWSAYRTGIGKFAQRLINPNLCTHAIYAYGRIYENNTFLPSDPISDLTMGGYVQINDLKQINPNFKTLIGVRDYSENRTLFPSIVASRERRQQLIESILDFLNMYSFDGIDIQWRNSMPNERDNFVRFVEEVSAKFDEEFEKNLKPRFLISIELPGKREDMNGFVISELNKFVDWFNALTYNYHSVSEDQVNHASSLYPLPEMPMDELNVDFTIREYLNSGADRNKLVITIPTYGHLFTLADIAQTDFGSPALERETEGMITRTRGRLAFYEICEFFKDVDWQIFQPYPRIVGPYIVKGNQWISFDDENMIKVKADYVADNGLGGIAFWSIDQDDFRGNCGNEPYLLIKAAKDRLEAKLGISNMFTTPGGITTTTDFSSTASSSSLMIVSPTSETVSEIEITNPMNNFQSSEISNPGMFPISNPICFDFSIVDLKSEITETVNIGNITEVISTTTVLSFVEIVTPNSNISDFILTTTPNSIDVNGIIQPTTNNLFNSNIENSLDERNRIVCYSPNWSRYGPQFAKFDSSFIVPDLCTHLIYAFAKIENDKILPTDVFADIDQKGYEKFNRIKRSNPQLATLISLSTKQEFSEIVNDMTKRTSFIENILDFLKLHNFDGIDIDWQYPGSNRNDKENFVQMLKEMNIKFEEDALIQKYSKFLITITIPWQEMYIDSGYDIPRLNELVNWFNLLSYNYHRPSELFVNHHAPLYGIKGVASTENNVNATVFSLINAGIERNKLVVGIPTYGISFTLADENQTDINSPASGPGMKGELSGLDGALPYYEICQKFSSDSESEWNISQIYSRFMGPYAFSGTRWVAYDDEEMVRLKANYVADNGLGGLMFWSLNQDDFRGICGDRQPNVLIQTAKRALLEKNSFSASVSSTVSAMPVDITMSTSVLSTQTTTGPPELLNFVCPDDGFFSNPRDCKTYYACFESIPYILHCQNGAYFDNSSQDCRFLENDQQCRELPNYEGPTTTHSPLIQFKKHNSTTTVLPFVEIVTPNISNISDSILTTTPNSINVNGIIQPTTNNLFNSNIENSLDERNRIVCYSPNWSRYRTQFAKFDSSFIVPDLCTHLIYAFAKIEDDKILPTDVFADIDQKGYEKFNRIKRSNPQLATLISLSTKQEFSEIVNDMTKRTSFIENLLDFLKLHNFNGIDIDWQYPGSNRNDKENFVQMLVEMNLKFEEDALIQKYSKFLITITIPWQEMYIDSGYDIPRLNELVNWFNLLSYNYHRPSELFVNHHAPLYGIKGVASTENNVNATVFSLINAGIERSKLVVGVPTYGISFTLADENQTDINSPASGPGMKGELSGLDGALPYYEICQKFSSDSESEWNISQTYSRFMGPYAFSGTRWVAYDDEEMVRIKANYVADNGLGGLMFWSLDQDDFRGICGNRQPNVLIQTAKRALLEKNSFSSSVSSTVSAMPVDITMSTSVLSTQTTTEPPELLNFVCPDDGLFPNPIDCTTYYGCFESIPYILNCTNGAYFDNSIQDCTFLENDQQCTKLPNYEGPEDQKDLILLLPNTTFNIPIDDSAEQKNRIVCYSRNWSRYRPQFAKFDSSFIIPDLCTHLIYAFAKIESDKIVPTDPFADIEEKGYEKFNRIKKANPQLLTLISISVREEFSDLVGDENRRKKFLNNILDFLKRHDFDGLDIDWQYPGTSNSNDKENFVKLLKEINDEFDLAAIEPQNKENYRFLITITIPWRNKYIDSGYDIVRLNAFVNWFNLLSYDYHGSDERFVNHHAPLFTLKGVAGTENNVNSTVFTLINAGIERSKLVVGVPTYGISFTLADENQTDINSPASGPGIKGELSGLNGSLPYYEICQKVSSDNEFAWDIRQVEPRVMGPYAFRGTRWVAYDDEEIMRLKANYVADHGLGGLMFWSIDQDDFRGICGDRQPNFLIQTAKKILLEKNSIKGSSEGLSTPSTEKPSFVAPDLPEVLDFECPKFGFFPNTRDCKTYYACFGLSDPKEKLKPHLLSCADGAYFNKNIVDCEFRDTDEQCPDQEKQVKSSKPPSIATEKTTASPTTENIGAIERLLKLIQSYGGIEKLEGVLKRFNFNGSDSADPSSHKSDTSSTISETPVINSNDFKKITVSTNINVDSNADDAIKSEFEVKKGKNNEKKITSSSDHIYQIKELHIHNYAPSTRESKNLNEDLKPNTDLIKVAKQPFILFAPVQVINKVES